MHLAGMFGYQELIIVLVIVLILFGAKKIPELARGLGKGIKEFKDAKDDIKSDIEDSIDDNTQDITDDNKN